jgi:hypothetical protein
MLALLVVFKGSLPKGPRSDSSWLLPKLVQSVQLGICPQNRRTTVPRIVPQASGYLPSTLPRLCKHEYTRAELPSITAH